MYYVQSTLVEMRPSHLRTTSYFHGHRDVPARTAQLAGVKRKFVIYVRGDLLSKVESNLLLACVYLTSNLPTRCLDPEIASAIQCSYRPKDSQEVFLKKQKQSSSVRALLVRVPVTPRDVR